MSRPDALAKLIADAAKAHLQPIGCQRVGRSRTWISDQRYWLIVVEFQPSSWQKGTYVNIGTMWLWRARKGLAFNTFRRIADFAPFSSSQQFVPVIAELAAQAAREVKRLREKFKSLSEICQYLVSHTSDNNRDIFHAAIAAGLVGDVTTAHRLFQKFSEVPTHGYQWTIALQATNSLLASKLEDPEAFRSAVVAKIRECRLINNLTPDEGCLDFLDSTKVMP
jgi:hypothetical protein